MIKTIRIVDFRLFSALEVSFKNGINVLVGSNGSGKSSVLEAIFYCCNIKSFRCNDFKDIISKNKDGFQICADFSIAEKNIRIRELRSIKSNEIYINDKLIRKTSEVIGLVGVIVFSFDDLVLLKGSSKERKQMLDLTLCSIYPEYLNILKTYNKIWLDRNSLLKKIKLSNYNEDYIMLDVVDEEYYNISRLLIEFRKKVIFSLSQKCSQLFKSIIKENENFEIFYSCSCDESQLKNKIKQQRTEDIKLGYSTVGPHRDDYVFMIGKDNILKYGSQGQQRICVICAKLALAELYKEIKKGEPIVLLDDVFSDLDKNLQTSILKYLDNGFQTIITSPEPVNIDFNILKNQNIINLDNINVDNSN